MITSLKSVQPKLNGYKGQSNILNDKSTEIMPRDNVLTCFWTGGFGNHDGVSSDGISSTAQLNKIQQKHAMFKTNNYLCWVLATGGPIL